MKFQVGDIVRYLNDVGGGVIQRIINATTVEISDDSGFVLPIQENQLVLVERPERKQKVVQNVIMEEEMATEELEEIEGNDSPHLYVAFLRNTKHSSAFDAYLINDSNYNILYVFSKIKDEEHQKLAAGQIDANSKIYVCSIETDALASYSLLHFSGVFYKNKSFAFQKNIDVDIHLHTVKFYKPGVFVVNDFFDEDAYVIDFYNAENTEKEKLRLKNVSGEEISAAMQEKNDLPVPEKREQKSTEKVREVDLHILELVEDDSALSPQEKLDLQLKTFEKELAQAIQDGCEKIVFIHGVGQGVLKAKIRGRLDRDYPQYFYQDASFQKYKFGATLVYLKKVYK